MSGSVEIRCDTGGGTVDQCRRRTWSSKSATVDEARKIAHARGWYSGPGGDFCPTCARQMGARR